MLFPYLGLTDIRAEPDMAAERYGKFRCARRYEGKEAEVQRESRLYYI